MVFDVQHHWRVCKMLLLKWFWLYVIKNIFLNNGFYELKNLMVKSNESWQNEKYVCLIWTLVSRVEPITSLGIKKCFKNYQNVCNHSSYNRCQNMCNWNCYKGLKHCSWNLLNPRKMACTWSWSPSSKHYVNIIHLQEWICSWMNDLTWMTII
jgi:hypothetical protein